MTKQFTSDELLNHLEQMDIEVTTVQHKPLLTVDDAKSVRTKDMTGGHCKNLFLRNKKGRMWLVTCHEDRVVDLKTLGQRLVETRSQNSNQTPNHALKQTPNRLSFASEERLMEYLGVIPGAVSPFGLVNDHAGDVTFFIDKALLDYKSLYFHPLDNCLTTEIRTDELVQYLENTNHPVNVVDFESPACGV